MPCNVANNYCTLPKMDFKIGVLLYVFLAGCTALPKPEDDLSEFFKDTTPPLSISGGIDAPFVIHPHMVAIYTGDGVKSIVGGGSLITKRTVLTTAHSISAVFNDGSLSSTLRMIVGTNGLNVGGTKYLVERNVTHPLYTNSLKTHDIGLLIATTDIEFSILVQPVGLTFDYIEAGVPCRVAGWGRLARQAMFISRLQELEITTIDGQECATAAANTVIELGTRAPPVYPHLQICTYQSAGYGVCNGDSGGPLIRSADGRQIGIVSWSFPCARGAPNIFVRISAYRGFIEENTV